jgi:xylulokinase
LGAAILAGAGAGIYDSPVDAAQRFLHLSNPYQPDSARQQVYNRHFELYRQVYPAVLPITHQL